MTNCPVCNTEVKEKAKFCSECGVQLTDAPSERAWIVAMQERIKATRHNDGIFNVIAAVGIVIAVVIPFIMRYVLLLTMTMTSWLITAVGVVLFLVSVISMWFDNRKVKELIEQLESGQEEEEEEGEEET
jgi:uncharacterized protein YacL